MTPFALGELVGRLVRFGWVGIISTIVYASLAWRLTHSGMDPAAASVVAYLVGAVVSYLGHRRFTFRSGEPHRAAIPRFVLTNALGLGIALAAPLVMTNGMGLPPQAAIAFTCVAVPILNFVLLDRLVFRRR